MWKHKCYSFEQHIDSVQCFIIVTVTPEDYEPPGFKEGESDSLWFEGTAVHFKVGKDWSDEL